MARYGLGTDIHDKYLDSPHGKVMKLVGSDVDGLYAATCTSCHGSHDVMDTDDPASPVGTTASLAAVCATCHPGANEEFASTLAVHEEFASEELSQLAFYGERFFFVLTAGVVGLGLLMVSLEGFGWLTGRGKGGHGPGGHAPGGGNPGDNPGDNPGKGSHENPEHNPDDNPKNNPGEHDPGGGNPGDNPGDSHERDPDGPRAATTTLSPPEALGGRSLDSRLPLPEEILRFDISQRLQHFLLMASFLVLAFTGLPQKFPDWGVSQWLIGVWGGLDSARTIHRFAGLVMIVDCLYHLAYVVYGTAALKKPIPIFYGTAALKKPIPIWMIPTPKDVIDFFQDLQCWFGLSSEKPKFGRFSYREKFDYWAIFWGVPVMAISGLVLMFPVLVSKVLPGDALSVALVAHSDEGVLAILWIFVVHFFFVHLNPRFFPLNPAIFTGRMSREAYAEEHALELATIEGRPDGGSPAGGTESGTIQVRGRTTEG
jgi:cytochrome b subunit of formate dehydrogenase